SLSERQQFVGELTGERRDGLAEVEVKNRFQRGDSVELMTPRGNLSLRVEDLRNAAGEAIEVAPGNGHVVYLALPEGLDLRYALLMRDLQPGQDTRQPQAERSGGCAGKGGCGCAH
ncbi:TPA: U32 family peptidase C-terminal domain-containing protein, partial [Pseudomonas aeruginosa]|nr:U32 family peptidase C-terminal domain-containing protein [Pseudomonas aeruginosa]